MAKLTKRVIDAAVAAKKDYVIWDDELPGFGLRVFVSGKRSYVLQYRAAGRSRRFTIPNVRFYYGLGVDPHALLIPPQSADQGIKPRIQLR